MGPGEGLFESELATHQLLATEDFKQRQKPCSIPKVLKEVVDKRLLGLRTGGGNARMINGGKLFALFCLHIQESIVLIYWAFICKSDIPWQVVN